ncbi:MAG: PKD domain-containing protein [Methanoregula sp.]
MKRSHHHIICVALSVLILCLILVPAVSAAAKVTKTPTPTPTVPPILQACSQARYPAAGFICGFTGNESPVIPDGPPYTIKCFDNSSTEFNQSVVSWKWDFGDGGTSNDQNPEHTYSAASRYDVKLTVTTFCGSQYSNSTIDFVTTYCSAPEPGFTTNVTEGYAPLTVRVTDTSLRTRTDITRWTYWFDNTHSSNERNTAFTYTTPGTYTINQTVWKDCVQLGNINYTPASRQIKVNPLSADIPVNETDVGPKTTITGAGPVATAPAGIAVTSDPLLATSPTQESAYMTSTGILSVTSEPSGAKVFVDDILRGTSPADIPDLSPGAHTLRFEREGYENMTMAFSISGGQTTTLSTSLMPVPGGIALLPVIILSLIMLSVLVGGIYLYLKQRFENAED